MFAIEPIAIFVLSTLCSKTITLYKMLPVNPTTSRAAVNRKALTSIKDNCHHDKACCSVSRYMSPSVVRTLSTTSAASSAGCRGLFRKRLVTRHLVCTCLHSYKCPFMWHIHCQGCTSHMQACVTCKHVLLIMACSDSPSQCLLWSWRSIVKGALNELSAKQFLCSQKEQSPKGWLLRIGVHHQLFPLFCNSWQSSNLVCSASCTAWWCLCFQQIIYRPMLFRYQRLCTTYQGLCMLQ